MKKLSPVKSIPRLSNERMNDEWFSMQTPSRKVFLFLNDERITTLNEH